MGKEYLESITIAAEPKDYVLPFWPDAKVPGGGTHQARWQGFLDVLSPKRRLAADPDTGAVGIPYKKGIWHTDLILADDVKSLSLIRDIRVVDGDLMARGARVVNKNFTHAVKVRGHLYVHLDILREDPPNLIYGGDLNVYGAKYVQDISISPQRFMLWGVSEDRRIRFREHMLMLVEEEEEDNTVHLLHDLATDNVYIWDFNRWEKAEKSGADQVVLAKVNHKLTRVCKYLGLGQDFILLNNRKIGSNIRKICVYLRFLMKSRGAEPGSEIKNLAVAPAFQIVTLLTDLEKNLYGSNVDVPNIDIMLGMLDDDLLKAAARLNTEPRRGLPEDPVKNDMRYLTRLLQDDVSFNELIPSTPHLIVFLNGALSSSLGKKALFKSIGPILSKFGPVVAALGLKGGVKFTHLLKKPGEVFGHMHQIADPMDRSEMVGMLEQYFNEIKARAPREFTRDVLGAMRALGVPDDSEDMRLIKIMVTFSGGINDFPIAKEALLDFYLATLTSSITGSLSRAKEYLAAGEESRDKGIQIFVGKFMAVSNMSFVEFLLKRLEWDVSVLKKFNALSRTEKKKAADQTKPERRIEKKELQPEIEAEILYKANRISLYLGLGKGFLEQNTGAWAKNLGKISALLEMWRSAYPPGGSGIEKQRAISGEFVRMLEALRDKAGVGDDNGVHTLLKGVDDEYIRRVEASLPAVRTPLSPKGYQRDMQVLEHLQKNGLTLETVFGSSEKILYYFNTMCESECLRRRVAGMVKPLRQAFENWKDRVDPLENVDLKDLMRKFENVVRPLAGRGATPEEKEAARDLRHAVDMIRASTVLETVVRLRKCRDKKADEVAARDNVLLDSLAEFRRGNLDGLHLEPVGVAKLLLLHMSSPAVEDVREMFASGRFDGKPALSIVRMVMSHLEWRENVVRAFNRLVGKAGKR